MDGLNMKKFFTTILAFTALLSSIGAAQTVPETAAGASSAAFPRVCCRPIYRFSHARFPLVRLLGVPARIWNHCFIELQPGYTIGIHPVESRAANKQPVPNQETDNIIYGGRCRKIEDATPGKIELLRQEIGGRACNSCGKDYHNKICAFCFNNSNTYVYDMLKAAGLKPPRFSRAPGYRLHHRCR